MFLLDYPEFIGFKSIGWIKGNTQEFLVTVDHPVIKYYGVNQKGEANLFDKDEKLICMMNLVAEKKDQYNSFVGGDGWVNSTGVSYSFKEHLNGCGNWDVTVRAINQLITTKNRSRFAIAAIFVYQQLKHKYEMENLTREFSSFRTAFEKKLDKLIETMANQPVVEEQPAPVEVKQEPKVEPKVEQPKPSYTAELVFKKAKNYGIAVAADFYGISEDRVRELKAQHRLKMKSK